MWRSRIIIYTSDIAGHISRCLSFSSFPFLFFSFSPCWQWCLCCHAVCYCYSLMLDTANTKQKRQESILRPFRYCWEHGHADSKFCCEWLLCIRHTLVSCWISIRLSISICTSVSTKEVHATRVHPMKTLLIMGPAIIHSTWLSAFGHWHGHRLCWHWLDAIKHNVTLRRSLTHNRHHHPQQHQWQLTILQGALYKIYYYDYMICNSGTKYKYCMKAHSMCLRLCWDECGSERVEL